MNQMREQFEAWKRTVPPVHSEELPMLWACWQAATQAALERAAKAVEDHDRSGREWVRGSLWDTLSREAAGRIRALMEQDK